MAESIVLWIHILAATLFVGPQAFLFMAAVPAMRTIEDVEARARATRVVTTRFGWIGGGALLVLIATGIYNYMHASDEGLLDLHRYFVVLQVKLGLVAIVVLLTFLHGAILGRRLLVLQQSGAGPEAIAATRRWSVAASVVIFTVSVAILLCAALLGSDWTKQ
jgi:uncharacterized membrane protein